MFVREIKSRAKGTLVYKNFLQNWSLSSKLQAHFSRTAFLPKLTSARILFLLIPILSTSFLIQKVENSNPGGHYSCMFQNAQWNILQHCASFMLSSSWHRRKPMQRSTNKKQGSTHPGAHSEATRRCAWEGSALSSWAGASPIHPLWGATGQTEVSGCLFLFLHL